MSEAHVSDLIRAVASLLGVLIWPAVLTLFFFRFRDPIAKFISEIGSLKAKAGGVEVSVVRRQVEAAAALGKAEALRSNATDSSTVDAAGIAETVNRAFPGGQSRQEVEGATVLWVDDRPENNRYEREALQALGITFILALSTDEALTKIRSEHVDLVISDMGRPPDPQAGYTLLDQLRGTNNQVKFVIYAGSRDPEHVRQARAHGAVGCTNSPRELISIVTEALQH